MKKLLSLFLAGAMMLSLAACGSAKDVDTSAIKVSAPNGAPAIALAAIAKENPDSCTFVAAETITAEFSNATADFVIAPINAGAKLYKMGKSTYKLAAVVSWGNLYFASQRDGFKLEDMNGAKVVLFGENTINSSIALYALKENGIVPASVEYLAGAANTQSLLLTDAEAIVLTAEPALTAAKIKNENITGYALNDLYKKATGNDGFTQAGLFVNPKTAEEQPDVVKAYLKKVEESAAKCTTDLETVAEAAASLGILPNAKVAAKAIPNCAVKYMSAKDAKKQIETTANIDLKQFGGEVPADDFYFEAK
ncbi:MAG: ABC transporter substrate-binding protein [Lachnospiraceae bacterium]|nr:ABC transporter substrate-binding protein [Lachnospiraceae bacterium]